MPAISPDHTTNEFADFLDSASNGTAGGITEFVDQMQNSPLSQAERLSQTADYYQSEFERFREAADRYAEAAHSRGDTDAGRA